MKASSNCFLIVGVVLVLYSMLSFSDVKCFSMVTVKKKGKKSIPKIKPQKIIYCLRVPVLSNF